ncbi:MAG: RdgB/HAM1 family non-canonical purine NTP pyrophosphatase [Planctomycetota bacterium]
MSIPPIVVATRNPGKLCEIRAVLAPLVPRIDGLEAFGDLPEPHETGETFAENARLKALGYACATGRWCLADDSGLEVDALDGAPGVRSARYAADRVAACAARARIDEANNRRLLEELADVPDERRTARFVCQLALASPQRVLLDARGTIEGRIAHRPAGDNGFGYDPLFYVPHLGCTTAQLPPDEKNRISHRGRAVREFARRLRRWSADADAPQG